MAGELDTYGLQFVTIDGFADFVLRNGILRMTAFRLSCDEQRIPIIGIDLMPAAMEQVRERVLGLTRKNACAVAIHH